MRPKIAISHVCSLANLKLTKEERNLLEPQMIKIVQWVDKLMEIELNGLEEEYSPISSNLPLREDKLLPSLPAEDALASSPEKQGRFIRVPKVIE